MEKKQCFLGFAYFFILSFLIAFIVSCNKDTSEITPVVTTQNATDIDITSATLNGTVNANNNTTIVSFEIGKNTSYGNTILATPNLVEGNINTTVSVTIDTLSINETYHFRVKAVTANKTVYGNDLTFTTKNGLKDIDGNVYPMVTIGTQVWMAKNLKVTHYRNGDPVPNISNNTQWTNLTSGAFCTYSNLSSYGEIYGNLYNWFTVVDVRNIAPEGWHVPSQAELSALVSFLGGSDIAGGKLKQTGTGCWNSPNTGATNSVGFEALGSGARWVNSVFDDLKHYCNFWVTSEFDQTRAHVLQLYNDSDDAVLGYGSKGNGFSIRCIKN